MPTKITTPITFIELFQTVKPQFTMKKQRARNQKNQQGQRKHHYLYALQNPSHSLTLLSTNPDGHPKPLKFYKR
uniref:Uncharacterized protein n=1 Tax=Rhizophora mucronata TaxID=61149 RepID=A0A2P2LYP9_RHIMU